MATWTQMLGTSSFIYWCCLISADFPVNSTFSNPSHARVFMGDYIPSTNMDSDMQDWSICYYRSEVNIRA